MKQMKTITILTALILSGCAMQNPEQVYWVDSLKIDCVGIGPMKCLRVQKSKEISSDNWQLFYNSIEGFDYEPGYIYQLSVKEESLLPQQVPADASSIKYTLIKVLEKAIDPKLRLHDIWAVENIQGEAITVTDKQPRPRLAFNLNTMQIMGTDGCNNFSGGIKNLDAKIMRFGGIASTRKFCPDMTVADQFNVQMSKVHRYILKDLKLRLFDELGNELLVFQKID